jgi:hypothetical protein
MKKLLGLLKDTITNDKEENESEMLAPQKEDFTPEKVQAEVEKMFKEEVLSERDFNTYSRAEIIDEIGKKSNIYESEVMPVADEAPSLFSYIEAETDDEHGHSKGDIEEHEKAMREWREEYVTSEWIDMVNDIKESIDSKIVGHLHTSGGQMEGIQELQQQLAEYPALYYMYMDLIYARTKIEKDTNDNT